MKTYNSRIKQLGFFDLGFSLALLAIFSVFSVAATNSSYETPQQLASCYEDHEKIEYSNACRK